MLKWLTARNPGVLGINRRNLEFIFAMNPRENFGSVDDKIVAKQRIIEAGLPTPRTIATVNQRGEISAVAHALAARSGFVVKPSRGFGGRGIKVFRETPEDEAELSFHMASILSGMYSLDQQRDRVLVEQRVTESSLLAAMHGGNSVSDLRIVVCQGEAIMAMLRLPCRDSGDAANLHAGGIGVGIDIARGTTTFAVQRGRPIDVHPDTGVGLGELTIPDWQNVLEMSRAITDVFGLGYIGVDIVLDEQLGAQILEVNARPGLTIQLANRRGLLDALPSSQKLA